MNPLRKLLSTVAAIVCAMLLSTVASASASVSNGQHHASRARISCLAHTARKRHRAHAAARDCRIRTHTVRHTQPHKTTVAPNAETAATDAAAARAASAREASTEIAAALATPCQNTELTPEAGNIDAVREAVLCLVNQERAQNGKVPLKVSGQLEQAAEGHCTELIADDYFAHVSPSGETPVDRIRETGYIPGPSVGYAIGENLAWGTLDLSTPSAIVAAWIASPGHLANILESQYTETGIGITPAVPSSLAEGEAGATYAQEFGSIIR